MIHSVWWFLQLDPSRIPSSIVKYASNSSLPHGSIKWMVMGQFNYAGPMGCSYVADNEISVYLRGCELFPTLFVPRRPPLFDHHDGLTEPRRANLYDVYKALCPSASVQGLLPTWPNIPLSGSERVIVLPSHTIHITRFPFLLRYIIPSMHWKHGEKG